MSRTPPASASRVVADRLHAAEVAALARLFDAGQDEVRAAARDYRLAARRGGQARQAESRTAATDVLQVAAGRSAGGSAAPVLTKREREVAALVVDGLKYQQVGARLAMSAKTVEHHVAHMRQKLGSASRAELFEQLRGLLG